jgi:uncharacterized membrane protein HdeD (DUF308 family)
MAQSQYGGAAGRGAGKPDLLDDVARSLRRARWEQIALGVLAIAFGIFAFARPAATIKALALLVAFWAFASGVMWIVRALELRRFASHWWLEMVAGLIGVAFGVIALARFPAPSISFIVIGVSWWLIVAGAVGITSAMRRRQGGWPWGWRLAGGLVSVIAGVFAIASPPLTLLALTTWIGIAALVIGGAHLADAGGKKQLERLIASTSDATPEPLRKTA